MPHLLLVEDNPVNREMLLRRLQRRGFEISIAEDGVEAIEQANAVRPDLILMDMTLPGIDGREATRRLRTEPATAAIPVIALTAETGDDADRASALEAGCDEYETKPIDLARLLKKIDDLIAEKDTGQ